MSPANPGMMHVCVADRTEEPLLVIEEKYGANDTSRVLVLTSSEIRQEVFFLAISTNSGHIFYDGKKRSTVRAVNITRRTLLSDVMRGKAAHVPNHNSRVSYLLLLWWFR